ncbi:YfhJ family protein [Microbacteriaceae bacterium 4G12]
MNDTIERLTKLLLSKNENLSYAQARAWVELLWEDFEATYAKAGKYNGAQMTGQVVATWIEHHGAQLHLTQTNNPKYKDLINRNDYLQH